MENEPLNFAGSDSRAGYRLEHMEIYNWGTFDGALWKLEPRGENSLLTGDIGSGKSTLVDAVTTLLVPHQRIIYNKAAGAETKERTLYHYVRGAFKEEKDEANQSGKIVYLRGERTYSVLLAYFYNHGLGSGATLAQFFWLQGGERAPQRFFVVADRQLTIAQHFTSPSANIATLRKELAKMPGISVIDNFREYSAKFRRIFGIESEKALELFYQTVSMKSVGNLNEFVRTHMLERGDVDERIEELKRSFENLTQAHEAVLIARRQIDMLQPLVTDGQRYDEVCALIEVLRGARGTLEVYFAEKQQNLVVQRLAELAHENSIVEAKRSARQDELLALRREDAEIARSIDQSGGQRIQLIDGEIQRLTAERNQRQALHSRYAETLAQLKLPPVIDAEGFAVAQRDASVLLESVEERSKSSDSKRIAGEVLLKEGRKSHHEIDEELRSLGQRRSNIPVRNLRLRDDLAATIRAEVDELPFVGELIQVREEEKSWEGATERVLRGFALSLLVPDRLYEAVSRYVNQTHLDEKLVYLRIRETDIKNQRSGLHPRSLVKKLRIEPRTPFLNFLNTELCNRFDLACCETIDEFRREPFALTREGQLKFNGVRHEKDDRRNVSDRSNFVLGWSNEEKKAALCGRLSVLEGEIARAAGEISNLQSALQSLSTTRDSCRDLLTQYQSFEELNWQLLVFRIEEQQAEKERIESSSDVLKTLRSRLEELRKRIIAADARLDEVKKQLGKLEQQRSDQTAKQAQLDAICATITVEMRERYFPTIDQFMSSAASPLELRLATIDQAQRTVREKIQERIDAEDKRAKRLSESILKSMKDYTAEFPADTVEIDAGLASLDEFRAILARRQREDLPRHEAKFKELLNKGTINGIALFQSQLDRWREEIREKIAAINLSLRDIEYNPGSYIQLVSDPSQDVDIRQFQFDLRQCLAHGLADSELYNEQKFMEVKAILDRFYGREGMSDADRRWTEKVTDVRNWFQFSASERWREDNKEREFYSGAAGKSGGQKEKLAYTILASALAYQFGLEWERARTQSFRFVVIDEAFGRGSDDSTRYALELFRKLKLQLLVVTPLQKINVIEDYVRTVHFTHNEQGRNSQIKILSHGEYQAEKRRFIEAGSAAIGAASTALAVGS